MGSIKASSVLSFGQQNYLNQRASMANTIFGGLNTGGSNFLGNYSFADWRSIKNGSYGKLVKAAYEKQGITNNHKKTDSKSAENKREYTKYEKSGALDKLLSTYDEKDKKVTTAEEKSASESSVSIATAAKNLSSAVKTIEKLETDDMDEAASAMQKFVDSYNSVVKSGSGSSISTVSRNTTWMIGTTDSRKARLSEVGITINKDKTLSFDKEVFKKADAGTINTLFAADDPNTIYADSYIAEIGDRADKIADAAASKGNSDKSYDAKGKYNGTSSGNAVDWTI